MKVLTLTQPWASLMCFDEKRYETRSWPTSHRGELAIHAAKTFPRHAKELCGTEPFRTVLARHGVKIWTDLPLGKILCVVNVIGCFKTIDYVAETHPDSNTPTMFRSTRPAEFEFNFGDYSPNRFFIVTRDVKPIEPIEAVGKLGLWEHTL